MSTIAHTLARRFRELFFNNRVNMKTTIIFLAGCMLAAFGMSAYAGEARERLDPIVSRLLAVKVEMTEARAEGAVLDSDEERNKDALAMLARSTEKIVAQGAVIEDDGEVLDAENAFYVRQVEQHNSNPPDTTDEGAVYAYNAMKQELDGWRQRLNTMIEAHNEVIKGHNKLAETLFVTEQTMREYSEQLSLRIQANREHISRLMEELANLDQQALAVCRELLEDKTTTDEALKLGCGNVQFDGANPNLPTGDGLKPDCRGFGEEECSNTTSPN